MKRAAAFLVLFLAGVAAAVALAAPPPGKGKPGATTAAASTTPRKVTLCHKTGSGKWVKVTVAQKAAAQRLKKGDRPVDAGGSCPAPSVPATTTTTP